MIDIFSFAKKYVCTKKDIHVNSTAIIANKTLFRQLNVLYFRRLLVGLDSMCGLDSMLIIFIYRYIIKLTPEEQGNSLTPRVMIMIQMGTHVS